MMLGVIVVAAPVVVVLQTSSSNAHTCPKKNGIFINS
jgi:hypothetical protein